MVAGCHVLTGILTRSKFTSVSEICCFPSLFAVPFNIYCLKETSALQSWTRGKKHTGKKSISSASYPLGMTATHKTDVYWQDLEEKIMAGLPKVSLAAWTYNRPSWSPQQHIQAQSVQKVFRKWNSKQVNVLKGSWIFISNKGSMAPMAVPLDYIQKQRRRW